MEELKGISRVNTARAELAGALVSYLELHLQLLIPSQMSKSDLPRSSGIGDQTVLQKEV